MVVKTKNALTSRLDLGYLSLFLGLRVNQLVMAKMRAAGFRHVRESYGYLIQHLIECDRTVTQLARRMEVTQQAASKSVAQLVKLKMLEIVPGPDRREKRVRLSARGWSLIRLGRQARRNIEQRLIRATGRNQYSQASSVLTACLHALGGVQRVRSRRVLPPS